jgi:hypothetical protein
MSITHSLALSPATILRKTATLALTLVGMQWFLLGMLPKGIVATLTEIF